jgi:hypothetical protein
MLAAGGAAAIQVVEAVSGAIQGLVEAVSGAIQGLVELGNAAAGASEEGEGQLWHAYGALPDSDTAECVIVTHTAAL